MNKQYYNIHFQVWKLRHKMINLHKILQLLSGRKGIFNKPSGSIAAYS